MILLYSGQNSRKMFDALLLFATQLDKRGHQLVIDARHVPEDISKQQKYEAAPFLADFEDLCPQTIIVIAAAEASEEVQSLLRSLNTKPDVAVWALGYFINLQDEINARNKIAYAIGREPKLIDLATPHKARLFEGAFAPQLTAISDRPQQKGDGPARLVVYVPFEGFDDPNTLPDLAALDCNGATELHLLTNGAGKDLIRRSRYSGLSVFGYSDLPPADLLNFADVIAFFGSSVPGERMAALAQQAMGVGKVVIDCTTNSGLSASGAPVLKGPEDLRALSNYLNDVVLKNRLDIGQRAQQSDWLKNFDVAALENCLNLAVATQKSAEEKARTIFMPTNGSGLGHAQRCALVREAMPLDSDCWFAAFPSCVDLLQRRGFACTPLVSRSSDHTDEYASDLLNFLRLRSLLRRGDALVFDGGFVFDSVYRVISALQMPSAWIRRGLWRQGQVHTTALEREHIFSKVIVPTEAFEELNTNYSQGDHVHNVGPIVRAEKQDKAEAEGLRERLSILFDRTIDTLVVSMLGGGVASDRTAQTQMMCSLMERRSKCLHLVVAWPNSIVENGLYGWKNTQVVYTNQTQHLCQAADLTVSAAGYNTFHELLYNGVPSILIPQSAPYLDDQEKRARAASERGLAALVLETEMVRLEREVASFLDDSRADVIRAALANEALPEPGNLSAAILVEGLTVK